MVFNKNLVWSEMNPEIKYEMFVDKRDSQVYRSVKIGEQTWMAENLNFEYTEGQGSFCYQNKEEYCDQYGRFYLWSSAVDSVAVFDDAAKGCGFAVDSTECGISDSVRVRGVCPEGWHLPSMTEWFELVDFVKKDTGYQKGQINNDLLSKKHGGKDLYGFGILLGGMRIGENSLYLDGYTTIHTTFNSKDEYRTLGVNSPGIGEEIDFGDQEKQNAFAYVRCIKD